jgi:hypothetical protein
MLAHETLDVLFTVPGNRIHLLNISTSFFDALWDIDLADMKFGKGVTLPRHARVRDTCAVVFHSGEPEVAMSQTGCRIAELKPQRAQKQHGVSRCIPSVILCALCG